MLPYFIYTEDIQNFCQFVGYITDDGVSLGVYACTYASTYTDTPFITTYNLDFGNNPLIPPEKVMEYLSLMLNGYAYEDAVKEIGVVWG